MTIPTLILVHNLGIKILNLFETVLELKKITKIILYPGGYRLDISEIKLLTIFSGKWKNP